MGQLLFIYIYVRWDNKLCIRRWRSAILLGFDMNKVAPNIRLRTEKGDAAVNVKLALPGKKCLIIFVEQGTLIKCKMIYGSDQLMYH